MVTSYVTSQAQRGGPAGGAYRRLSFGMLAPHEAGRVPVNKFTGIRLAATHNSFVSVDSAALLWGVVWVGTNSTSASFMLRCCKLRGTLY